PSGRRGVSDGADRLIHFMGDGGSELSHGWDAVRMRQLRLHLTVAPVVFVSRRFRPLAFSDIAAHDPDVHGPRGLRIVEPKGRIEDRDRSSGLEMAETHLSRPGALLQHRGPKDLIHEMTVLGEHVVNS